MLPGATRIIDAHVACRRRPPRGGDRVAWVTIGDRPTELEVNRGHCGARDPPSIVGLQIGGGRHDQRQRSTVLDMLLTAVPGVVGIVPVATSVGVRTMK